MNLFSKITFHNDVILCKENNFTILLKISNRKINYILYHFNAIEERDVFN